MSYKSLALAVLRLAIVDGDTAALEGRWCELLADFADADIERFKKEAAGHETKKPSRSDFLEIPQGCRGRSYSETIRNIGALPAVFTADQIAAFMGITRQHVTVLAAHLKVRYKRLTHIERAARTRNQWTRRENESSSL